MIKRLMTFSYQHPKSLLLLLVVLALAVAPMLSRLQFDISAQSLLVKDDPVWQDYQSSLDKFGADSTILVIFSDPDLLTKNKLQTIEKSVTQLEALEFVKNSTSLFNVPNIQEVDGFVDSRPFLDQLPETQPQIDKLIKDAVQNPLVVGNLISPDGKTLSINLHIDDTIHFSGRDHQITTQIAEIIDPLQSEFSSVYQMSSPYVREVISQQIQIDQNLILPAAIAVLIVVLGLSMGRLNCSIVPLSSAAISIVVTLGFMAWMEIPVNVMTSIIPALLIIIGSTEDVHLMAEYHSGIKDGLTRSEAVSRLPVNQALAVMLAFVTTLVGFLSITISDLQLLREFGLLVSFGLVVNFLVTTLFVPAYLILFGSTNIGTDDRKSIFHLIADKIFSVVIRFRKVTLFLVLALTLWFIWGAQYLQINNNTLAYFSPESDVRQKAEDIHQRLSGMQTFSIVLTSPVEGTFKKVRYLEEVEKIQQFLDQRAVFDKTLSFADFVKMTHRIMEGIEEPMLPLDDEVVQIYMEFIQFDAVKSYVNEDFSSTRILVRHNIPSGEALDREFAAIRNFIEQDLNTRLDYTLTGNSVLNNHAGDSMAYGQIQSLMLMVLAILLLVSILFIDIRAGIIALIPNVFPVIALFGIMGYYQIPLDTGTTMVAVIALGICVDDTIHFLSRYHFYTRGNHDVEMALRKTIEHESRPIITTSIALALGFLTLAYSSFQPVIYFGLLSALVMMLAVFSTFILTPVLLSFTKLVTVWDMLSINIKSTVIENSEIFSGLRSYQIKQAILSGEIVHYPGNEVIIDQGVAGDELFVMLEGSALATRRDDDGSIHTIRKIEPGQLFGELARFSNRIRTARVKTLKPTQLLVLKWDGIQHLSRFHPRIAAKLFHNLTSIMSKRLQDISDDRTHSRDELTGALTKAYLCEFLRHEITRSHYFAEPITLMMLQLDVENAVGESIMSLSDESVLKVTNIIHQALQPVDIFARWARCSFMIVMSQSVSENAVNVARQIEDQINHAEFSEDVHLYMNVAVTEVNHAESSEQAIRRIEKMIYNKTRNRKSVSVAVG